jgi:hypothetical protein
LGAPPGQIPVGPRHDPGFVDRCLVDLFTHWGRWRRLGRLYAPHVPSFERCCMVREAVEKGRRLGFEIEGDCTKGYRVVSFAHPELLYLTKPGPAAGRELVDTPVAETPLQPRGKQPAQQRMTGA